MMRDLNLTSYAFSKKAAELQAPRQGEYTTERLAVFEAARNVVMMCL